MRAGVGKLRRWVHERRSAGDGDREEHDASWYDSSFRRNAHWKQDYPDSRYYFLWAVIADRVVREQASAVLEIACGTGQLARLLTDKGLHSYCGFDFSEQRVEFARRASPDLRFEVADAYETPLFDSFSYDTVVCTEFLEHVEGDLAVLDRIRAGARVHATVPNFPYTSHVRHFVGVREVEARYGSRFTDLRVDPFRGQRDQVFFLMQGTKS
jgi:SAM-dependent methyltransferase